MKNGNHSTEQLFYWNRLLCSPLEAIYPLLIFIVSKELNANYLQLTLLASTKPVVSLFAFYISSLILGNRQGRIRSYLIALNIAGCLPSLFFPFVENVWIYVASYIVFMTALRAAFPPWNEMLRSNVGLDGMRNILSKGTSINYFITLFVPLLFSHWMDQHNQQWKGVFFIFGVVQLINTLFLLRLQFKPLENATNASVSTSTAPLLLISPWRNGWSLLKEKPEFRKYLLLFFLGGIGLVAIQPLLPIFFKENLQLSYLQLTFAFSCCKGIAFLFSSPLWARWIQKMSLYLFNCYVNLFSCLFFAFLLASSAHTDWLYIAYLMYGTMQAGCELSWNLSGPFFSKERESTLYSGLNLVFVGIRGCLCPWMGQLLFFHSNIFVVLSVAGGLSILSCLYALWLDREFKAKSSVCAFS